MSSGGFEVAMHEAAHVVVGVALGLKLRRASARPWAEWDGYCWFPVPAGRREWALAVMTAAGVAWERPRWPDDTEGPQRADWADLLEQVPSRHDAETCVKAAEAILERLRLAHRKVTQALLERDITGADIEAMVHGEELEE